MDQVRSQLGQRLKDKPALMQARVGHIQPGFVDNPVIIEQQVKIQRARTPANVRRAAAGLNFNLLQGAQEVAGRQRRRQFHDSVKVRGLGRPADRHGLPDGRHLDQPHVGQRAQRLRAAGDVLQPIALIGADADEDASHA